MPQTRCISSDLSYKGVIENLFRLERLGIRMGLTHVEEALHHLGNPHKVFPTVHVGGTNGKGSTSAMLDGVLTAGGYRVGLYTSPHLVSFNERIRVAGKDIPDDSLVRVFCEVKGRLPRGLNLTFFEFATVMAFLYFAEEGVDIAVVEVGMGGRLDATNVVTPLLSVITNISREHESILGRGVRRIAAEKGGIIKGGVPLVTATRGGVLDLLKEICRHKDGGPIHVLGEHFRIKRYGRAFDFHGSYTDYIGLRTNLDGPHQIVNAACALEATGILGRSGFDVAGEDVREGLVKTRWPGRVERAWDHPMTVLDCAHNPAGATVLKKALRGFEYRRLILVMGMLKGKDVEGFVSRIGPLADSAIVTRPRSGRAESPSAVSSVTRRYVEDVIVVGKVKDACREAMARAGEMDLVLVTGSMFTVGEAREYLLSCGRVE